VARGNASERSAGGAAGVRLTDRISLGVIADLVPRDLIEEVLNETGRREKRSRLLPAHVTVRFCQAMCLFFDDDYEEVMHKLVGGGVAALHGFLVGFVACAVYFGDLTGSATSRGGAGARVVSAGSGSDGRARRQGRMVARTPIDGH
jgi:Insertion element 4 transposase N-terminal